MHPPKREVFDLDAMTNTDPKGIVRSVDEYRLEPWGLFMARPTPGRAQFHYLESWLLPTLGLRANIFHFSPGYERDQDFYLDVGDFVPGPSQWVAVDHYLDLVVRRGRETELTDVDELLEAHKAGLLSTATTELAVHRAAATISHLAGHGHDLNAWLASAGMPLTWRDLNGDTHV